MKIKFLAFINDNTSKAWRTQMEGDFLSADMGQTIDGDWDCAIREKLTDAFPDFVDNSQGYSGKINAVRQLKTDGKVTADNQQVYYEALHFYKKKRQVEWLQYLLQKTAECFSQELGQLAGEDLDKSKTTLVAALPEFFWYDINDNKKHETDITYYHKPLYENEMIETLCSDNPLRGLVSNFPNLLIFAGTAIWKRINTDNHKEEKIYNTLISYYAQGEECKLGLWTKHNISTIDGFCKEVQDSSGSHSVIVKNKIGKATDSLPPVLRFNDMTFAYDICLDFRCGEGKIPLSADLCAKAGIVPDMNVLIAAGMGVQPADMQKMKSKGLLRCDGLRNPNMQILTGTNDLSYTRSAGDCVIGCLETEV